MRTTAVTRRESLKVVFAACITGIFDEGFAMNTATATASPASDYVEVSSPFAFQETLSRLEAAIVKAGSTVFARIDHAAGASQAGLDLPPTVVLIYGNARGGTPRMVADPAIALDLPLRVLVHETGGGVSIGYHPVATFQRPGVADALWTRLEPAQRLLVDALKA